MNRSRMAAMLAAMALLQSCQNSAYGPWPRPPVPGTVRDYPCRFTASRPNLDGALDDGLWAKAPWSEPFMDIEGPEKPKPRHRTWVKMLWDEKFLYVGALLEEPHVWGTYDKRDLVVFHENDFEIFIDPDGDGAGYYEVEVNAKGTIFDLYLHKAYRAGGPAMTHWNCAGVEGSVRVQGTLNDGTDTDRSWTVALAIPWEGLKPPADAPHEGPEATRGGTAPGVGETWRINFSRVEWQVDWKDGAYAKRPGTREDNWVWTPQWAIDMHRPEHWGRVHFTK